MIKKQLFFPLLFLILLLLAVSYIFAQECEKLNSNNLQKVEDVSNHYSHFNIDNISTIIYNDGRADISTTGNSGFEFPKGSGNTAVFQSGLLWGAKVNGQVRVGGSHYRTGLKPGKVFASGVEDPNSQTARVYRVRPDYLTADFSSETNDYEGTLTNIRNQYQKDWIEWPAGDGAPFEDIDGGGYYNWQVDIPGIAGADQTLWFVANDFDEDQTKYLYGSQPMGIELQVTVWGYNSSSVLQNCLFKKYKIINKSVDSFQDMYVSMWFDADIGNAVDDLAGCDTTLNLGYGYNGQEYDDDYGYLPPAVGFDLLQGPIITGNPDDEAIYDGRKILGKRNLPMTAFNHFI